MDWMQENGRVSLKFRSWIMAHKEMWGPRAGMKVVVVRRAAEVLNIEHITSS